MKKRKLIINADDFGLSPSVNRAILDCFRMGNVTSATLMANMPGTEDAAALAKENPGLSVGLHFSLTEGRPLSSCPTLVARDGSFHDRTGLFLRSFFRRIDPDDVRREFTAQMEKVRALGIVITHVDSHQHVHMDPGILGCISPLVAAKNVPLRLVYPPVDLSLLLTRPIKFFKQIRLRQISRRVLPHRTVRANDRLVSIHDLSSTEGLNPAVYGKLIRGAGNPEILEVMVHPYILGDDVSALYKGCLNTSRMEFLKKCELEYRLLSDEGLFARERGYELTSYADL